MADVLLSKVSKVYPGGVKAVDAIDLSIADGSFVVLVGPSGCGKSTTRRRIAGHEEISSGTIAIGGRVVNEVAARDRDIAMVFQSYALYPHMTVFENIGFSLKLRRQPAAQITERVTAVAEMLDLLEDPGLCARCVKAAADRFALTDGIAAYRAIYRELAGAA